MGVVMDLLEATALKMMDRRIVAALDLDLDQVATGLDLPLA
jgi:hypothetical protein